MYERMSAGQNYIVVINMSDEQYNNFEFGYDRNAVLHEVLSGERREYGGYFDGSKEDIPRRSRDTNGGNASSASSFRRWRPSYTGWNSCRSQKKNPTGSRICREEI